MSPLLTVAIVNFSAAVAVPASDAASTAPVNVLSAVLIMELLPFFLAKIDIQQLLLLGFNGFLHLKKSEIEQLLC
jgi:hypothetical protein